MMKRYKVWIEIECIDAEGNADSDDTETEYCGEHTSLDIARDAMAIGQQAIEAKYGPPNG